MDGGGATDARLLRRLGTQEFGDPVNQSGFEHVPFLGKPRFMKPLRMALVPVKTPAQEQALRRPRDLFERHDVATLPPEVRVVAHDFQARNAAPGGVAHENAGESPRQLACQQES